MRKTMPYQLEKWIWSEADFEQMGWHDATIYATQFGQDISFDTDYIFEWVQADKNDFSSFVVAPVTLVFRESTIIKFDLDFRLGQKIKVEDLHRTTSATGDTQWFLETHQGDIIITAETFRQIVRRLPTLQIGQQLSPEERGDSNFSTVPELDFVVPEEVTRMKEAEFALRQKSTEIRHLQRQLEILREQRSVGMLEVKQYLLEKRETEKKIRDLSHQFRSMDWQDIL